MSIPRDRLDLGQHAVTAVLAAVLGALLAALPAEQDATLRTLSFAGAPFVVLAGLHARTATFLRTPMRRRLSRLPVPGQAHGADAGGVHLRSSLAALLVACAAIALAMFSIDAAAVVVRTLVWIAWVWVLALLVEPAVAGAAAASADPQTEGGRELRKSMSGGVTTSGGAVHLWAPAFTVAGALALAMPAELVSQRHAGWAGLSDATGAAALLVPLALAFAARTWAQRAYAAGLWPAIAELAEAERTLAGPAEPEPAPGWLPFRDPLRRLVALQLLRGTPLPVFRLVLVLAWSLGCATGFLRASTPTLAVGIACAALWALPTRGFLKRGADTRQRLCAALPLPAMRAEAGAFSWGLALSPALVGALAFLFGAWRQGGMA